MPQSPSVPSVPSVLYVLSPHTDENWYNLPFPRVIDPHHPAQQVVQARLRRPKLPNLTYLLVYENMAAKDKAWGAFGADPEWKKLRGTPGFTDPEIVSNISNVFLRPTGYSQI